MNQTDAAILELESKIAKRQATLATLETEIAGLEEKKKEKEAELPEVRFDLEALNRSLAIVKGTVRDKTDEQTFASLSSFTSPGVKTSNIVPGSHTDLARGVLLEHKSPLRMSTLFAKAKAKKAELNKRSFGANVYRLASEKKIFKVDQKKIALLEWGND